jgi:methionyl-tRNA formyltransferase
MKDPAFLEALGAWQPDLIAVAAFGRILPPVILEMPPHGCVNVHGSLLPKYRGAGPIQWAILNGEQETGITTMSMDAGMDTGAILLQERVTVEPDDTAGSLSVKLAQVGGRLLMETIRRLKGGSIVPRAQDHSQATMAPLLQKEDGLIDWSLPAMAIANRVRGLSPWPGAYTFAGEERWTLCRASAESGDVRRSGDSQPGAIMHVNKDSLLVATGNGLLMITELKPANSRRMSIHDYLAGHPVRLGLILGPGPAASTQRSG